MGKFTDKLQKKKMEKQNINVNPATLRNVRCKCGCMYFRPIFVLKTVPALMYGGPQDALITIQIWICTACREILPTSLPAIKEPDEPQTKIIHE